MSSSERPSSESLATASIAERRRSNGLISVVAPVFNELDNLEELVRQLEGALAPLGLPYELIFVDDASTDGGLELLEALAVHRASLRVFGLEKRVGQSGALSVGLDYAVGDVVVTIDSDLQNDPADIPRLLLALDDFDLVSGVREKRRDSWLRLWVSRVANSVRRRVLGDPFTDVGCSLKVYRSHVLEGIPTFDGMHRFLPVLVASRGARCTELPVSHRPRRKGSSKYGAVRGRMVRGIRDTLGVRWLIDRSVLPREQGRSVSIRGKVDESSAEMQGVEARVQTKRRARS